jgi:predicted nucleic acid-binding protein
MPDKVIDASALAALAFAEPGADLVLDAIDGHRIHAPTLLSFELMNVAWKRLKKSPSSASMFFESLEDTQNFGIQFRGVDHRAVVELAVETGLTAYDASYLWLSRHLNAPLVTLDRKLAAHAKNF